MKKATPQILRYHAREILSECSGDLQAALDAAEQEAVNRFGDDGEKSLPFLAALLCGVIKGESRNQRTKERNLQE